MKTLLMLLLLSANAYCSPICELCDKEVKLTDKHFRTTIRYLITSVGYNDSDWDDELQYFHNKCAEDLAYFLVDLYKESQTKVSE